MIAEIYGFSLQVFHVAVLLFAEGFRSFVGLSMSLRRGKNLFKVAKGPALTCKMDASDIKGETMGVINQIYCSTCWHKKKIKQF